MRGRLDFPLRPSRIKRAKWIERADVSERRLWYPVGVQTNLERFLQPAEWTLHEAVWVAWPSALDLWKEKLAPAQRAFVSMCEAIADVDPRTGEPRGERIELLVPDDARRRQAVAHMRPLAPRAHAIAFGDIWLRDTAPIFVLSGEAPVQAACFRFNGWGGK
jgi:agmatine deiminase